MSIASELSRLQQAKSDLATSITNKGVTVPATTTIDGYAALVDQIQQGGVTLPYDAEIQYIESTGTQYIDTGEVVIYGSDVVEIALNIAITSGTSRQLNGANGNLYFGVNASKKFEVSGTAAGTYNNNFHDWYLHCKTGRKITGVIDGAVYYSAGNVPSVTYGYAIFLFAIGGRDNAAAQLFIKQKLKAAVIKKNGKVVRDYIPVRVGQTGCLYDRVSGGLFYNLGTGSFTLGPDVT
jgi:hypothetical protein